MTRLIATLILVALVVIVPALVLLHAVSEIGRVVGP